jgi:tRNA-dihydrouridine synthase 1
MTEMTDDHCQRAWDWWRSIGQPKRVCAPMVANSELAFRLLVRQHGADLAYTPMIVASTFLKMSHAQRLAVIEPHPEE